MSHEPHTCEIQQISSSVITAHDFKESTVSNWETGGNIRSDDHDIGGERMRITDLGSLNNASTSIDCTIYAAFSNANYRTAKADRAGSKFTPFHRGLIDAHKRTEAERYARVNWRAPRGLPQSAESEYHIRASIRPENTHPRSPQLCVHASWAELPFPTQSYDIDRQHQAGNESRFINHDPKNANCHAGGPSHTEVRLVNGEHRIGLFTRKFLSPSFPIPSSVP
ncbi:hypothetical protein FPV67DRAFT_1449124 [Lyophyllum atratum]|nr:hypothetical protein FPV67DRAFT_1449124 [Lyophyllum atratum]